MHDIILKRFEEPDELREFEKGRFEVVHFDGMTIGRATYEPGWKWSVDVSPLTGTDFCEIEHLGMVLEGHATCAFKDGEVYTWAGRSVLHRPRAARQLGGRRREIRLTALPRRRQVR